MGGMGQGIIVTHTQDDWLHTGFECNGGKVKGKESKRQLMINGLNLLDFDGTT